MDANNSKDVPNAQIRNVQRVTVDIDRLRPDPIRVEEERRSNAWAGAGGAACSVGFGNFILHAMVNAHKQNAPSVLWGVVAGVIAAPFGALAGHSRKTSEEERSETLIRAAKSGMFEEALKYDMRKRESDAYRRGAANSISP